MLDGYKNSNGISKKNVALNLVARPPALGKPVKEIELNNWNKTTGKTFFIGEFSSSRLLSALLDSDLGRLMPYFQAVTFACGENVYQPDDGGHFIYFPESAVFSQINILEDGKTVETAMIGNEGIVGITAILGSQISSVPWTQTLVGGNALKINTLIFKQEFRRNGVLHPAFFEYLNTFIKQITQKAVCNQHHLIEERFSTWLLMIDDRCGNDKLVLTHEQIAHFLGVHRPSVSCIAQNLRDRGIINYSRGRISILDRLSLENSACECYTVIN